MNSNQFESEFFQFYKKILNFLGILKSRLPILAKLGAISIVIDHKWILGRQGDPEKKALGIVAVVSSDDGTRYPITLGYLPTDDASGSV